MQTDVKAKSLGASGLVFEGRTRVKGLIIAASSSAGNVTLADGGVNVFAVQTVANGESFNALIPGEGVVFSTYCGSGLMAASFYVANVAVSGNAVVASGQTSEVILPANAVVTSVTITTPIRSGSINVGFTTVTGGISDAAFYGNATAAT